MPVTVTFGNCPECKETFPHCICPKKQYAPYKVLVGEVLWRCPECANQVLITHADNNSFRSGDWCEHQQKIYGFKNE